MVTYRSYRVTPGGSIEGASEFIEADDDTAALVEARRAVTLAFGIEVWLDDRKIGLLPPRPGRLAGGALWRRGPDRAVGTLWRRSPGAAD